MKLNKKLGIIFWILIICFMCAYNIAHPGIAKYFYTGFFSCTAIFTIAEIFKF